MTVSGDTIAAISTAPGRGGVAVVRVSGPDSFAVARAVAGKVPEPGAFRFAQFRHGGAAVDSGLVLAFRAPRSYTGEDAVEFHCHGGTVAPARVLDAVLSSGARQAAPGEFTKRAFLNGKLDLDQASAVIDLIDAKTSRAADAALAELDPGSRGTGAKRLKELYSQAIDVSSVFEHALDIDEGDLPPDFAESTARSAAALAGSLEAEAARLREKRILRDGALVVLAGEPNAGKSSLLNALLDSDRAIVSPVPGTTRDAIDAWTSIRGWPVRIVDTAGIRRAGDPVEAQGVARSESLAAAADVLVVLVPPGGDAAAADAIAARSARTIVVSSKCDLARGRHLNVSSATREGIEELEDAVARALEDMAASPDGGRADETSSRIAALASAARALRAVAVAPDPAAAANSAAAAARILGEAAGAEYSNDLMDRIFSRFCVGK